MNESTMKFSTCNLVNPEVRQILLCSTGPLFKSVLQEVTESHSAAAAEEMKPWMFADTQEMRIDDSAREVKG